MPRHEFFAALFIIGCANGLGARIIDTVRWVGWADAALSTYLAHRMARARGLKPETT